MSANSDHAPLDHWHIECTVYCLAAFGGIHAIDVVNYLLLVEIRQYIVHGLATNCLCLVFQRQYIPPIIYRNKHEFV